MNNNFVVFGKLSIPFTGSFLFINANVKFVYRQFFVWQLTVFVYQHKY